jgi:hypothetical protein
MKDHRIAQVINELRDAAIKFGHTQQLRAHISRIVIDAIKEQDKDTRHACAENLIQFGSDTIRIGHIGVDEAHNICMNTTSGLSKKTADFLGD